MGTLCTVCNHYPCPGCLGAAHDEIGRLRVALLNKGEKLDAVAHAAGGVLSGLHEREYHNPHDAMWKHYRAELIRLLAECGVVPDGANESPEKVQ